jgi:hypothetical protein
VTHRELQAELQRLGVYHGKLDGDFGPKSRQAFMDAITMGPDTPLGIPQVIAAAAALKTSTANIWAVYDVEAAGNPFIDGRPTILFEPHIFSRLTDHRYDSSHPRISSRKWNRKLYPGSQAGRWQQLLDAIVLDPDAAISAASYGGFQILGQHWKALDYKSAFDFLMRQSVSVGEQLNAFVKFLQVNRLDDELRANNWAAFARGYNGPGYAQNHYDTRLAARAALRARA